MKKIVHLILFLFLVSCGQAQNKVKTLPLTGNGKQDILILLPEGEYQVDIVDKVVMDTKTQIMMQKFQTAVQKNPEWFLEQQQKVKETGQQLPYDEKLGLTKEEYKDFLNLSKNPNSMQMTKSSSETISIKYDKGKVTLKGTGKLSVLDNLTINLQDLTARIENINLSKAEAVNINTADNGLRSKWKGFTWRYENSNKQPEELKTIADYQDLQMKLYKVTIGQLETTGKTYIDFKGSEIDNGQKTVSFQIPIIFQ
jgi:hypothetical protein